MGRILRIGFYQEFLRPVGSKRAELERENLRMYQLDLVDPCS